MTLDLTAEESAALLAELDRVIDNDRYPFSPRIRTLTAIRDKIAASKKKGMWMGGNVPLSLGFA